MKTERSAGTILAAVLITTLAAAILAPVPALAEAPQPPPGEKSAGPTAPKERLAAIRKSFAESQALLRSYEWIETTVTSLKGEEKSRKQNRCYYGADGKIQKVPVAAPPEEKPGRGLRGRIKEHKKEELADYMEDAAVLMHKYLPPDHEKIQKCEDAGKTSMHILEPDKRAKVEFRDYLQPGDSLGVEVDLTNNTILRVGVASSLGDHKDPIALDVRFDEFADGTIYAAETVLEAKAKHVRVTVQISGYRRTTP